MEYNMPELLAPAGDLEKLKIAVKYGANAVYMAGQSLGLRAKAKNFDLKQMEEGINFAHKSNVRVYVTANIFAHNEDFEGMEQYFKELEKVGVDAVIISDLGIFSIAREAVPNMEIHISTQANITNYKNANMWHSLGAKRVVLARELSFKEIREVRDNTPKDLEIEAFVHGAMCISYSGRCLLSNYLSNRDSNRGACSQPCRWKYSVVEQTRPNEYMPVYEDDRGTYIYNSKDLCMINYIPELLQSGIGSFKIEGRMKTPYYVGTIVKAYRQAIDTYLEDPEKYKQNESYYMEEVQKASHRNYTTGFYNNKTNEDDQIYDSSSYIRTYDFVGMVKSYDSKTQMATVEQRNKFVVGDEVEFFVAEGEPFKQVITEMYDENGESISEAPHPQQILKIKVIKELKEFDMLRKQM